MDLSDVNKGIETATKLIEKTLDIKKDIEDESMFIKRIIGKFKTKEGKDCSIIIYMGVMEDVKELRIIARGVKNLAILREIPFDDFEDSIKGPGIKRE
ncbi:MAG: hypothetical protein EAX96_04585 [Candidatus Lokiarchaeota archaeon]|nr:hypothetical protein [Candidatus Lokiarchaeota archaeon]